MLAGRYQPTGVKLTGGQGDVELCRDVWLDRDVVIKRLHTGGNVAALMKEVTARQKVVSKYLAQIYDFFLGPDGSPRLVVEYIPGEGLASEAVIPVSDDQSLLRLLYQLASGIADFHAAGIVHRDIKPHNCRLDSEGILRLFDLGISTDLTETETTKLGAGTPGFLAPELYAKGTKAVSPSIDTYAWGATAWFLRTGGLPKALVSVPPQAKTNAPAFASQCPLPVLSELVDNALAPKPASRPAMSMIVEKLRAELTVGRHRGVLVGNNGKQFVIDKDNTTISVGRRHYGQRISIHYDGYKFVITSCEGDVFVNNYAATAGAIFPKACVVTFGADGVNRSFLNFCSAHPEVLF